MYAINNFFPSYIFLYDTEGTYLDGYSTSHEFKQIKIYGGQMYALDADEITFYEGNTNQSPIVFEVLHSIPINWTIIKAFNIFDQYLYYSLDNGSLRRYDFATEFEISIGSFSGIQKVIVSPSGDIYFTQFNDTTGKTKIKKYINHTTAQDFVTREFSTINDLVIDGGIGNMYVTELDTGKIIRIYDASLLGHTNVKIPDANFKAALVNNSSINTNADTEIQYTEAEAYTGDIDVNNIGILDLTGIEAFKNLTSLNCSNNSLEFLNITSNGQLNQLQCNNNSLTRLNTTHNAHLTVINCWGNTITHLDLTKNLALENFTAENMNTLIELDLSNNTALKELTCSSTQLTFIDLRNGTNSNINNFSISNAENLSCIYVDDKIYSTTNWTNPNPGTTTFVETNAECNNVLSTNTVTITNFSIYPNPTSSTININIPVKKVKVFNLAGKLVIEHTTPQLNVSHLEKGFYLIQVTGLNNKISTKKIIIQ